MASPARHSSSSTGTCSKEAGSNACWVCSSFMGLASFPGKIGIVSDVELAQAGGPLLVGDGRAAGVPAGGVPDLGVVAVADDGHRLAQARVGPQAGGQQDAPLLVRGHLAGGAEQVADRKSTRLN